MLIERYRARFIPYSVDPYGLVDPPDLKDKLKSQLEKQRDKLWEIIAAGLAGARVPGDIINEAKSAFVKISDQNIKDIMDSPLINRVNAMVQPTVDEFVERINNIPSLVQHLTLGLVQAGIKAYEFRKDKKCEQEFKATIPVHESGWWSMKVRLVGAVGIQQNPNTPEFGKDTWNLSSVTPFAQVGLESDLKVHFTGAGLLTATGRYAARYMDDAFTDHEVSLTVGISW